MAKEDTFWDTKGLKIKDVQNITILIYVKYRGQLVYFNKMLWIMEIVL